MAIARIRPNSRPYARSEINQFSTLNRHTRHYYVFRSQMERFERTPGADTLIVEPGTYTISNTVYIPSNVRIILRDGATLRKGSRTGLRGSNSFQASDSMLVFAPPSRATRRGSIGGYRGTANSAIIGEGNATIDLRHRRRPNNLPTLAIVAAHNRNIEIRGLTFRGLADGHYIEMDANSGSTISNNRFIDTVPSHRGRDEAINLDVPNTLTRGITALWSRYDDTRNQDISIRDNLFEDVDRAIGSHQFVRGVYHDNITIEGNIIRRSRSDAIRLWNWRNPIIRNNTFDTVTGNSDSRPLRGILGTGAIDPVIEGNRFINTGRAMQFFPDMNATNAIEENGISYNSFSQESLESLSRNQGIGLDPRDTDRDGNYFIRINSEYDVFSNPTRVPLLGLPV